jgi:hypothetical protein
MGFNRHVSSTYRFAGPFVVRLAGVGLALVGLLVLLLVGAVLVFSLPALALTVGLAVGLLLWLTVLAASAVLQRRDVVRLDARGYRVRHVRGAGVREARWTDVEDVTAPTVEGERCVVLRLRDGRSTTIPVDVLAGSADGFVADLRRHLDDGHGYRPVPRSRS